MRDARPVFVALTWVVLVASCSSTGNSPDEGLPLPSRDDAGDADAAASASDAGQDAKAPCDLTAPFGVPGLITEVNTADEDLISDISSDELTMFLSSNHDAPSLQLFYLTRPNKSSPWGARVPLSETGSWDDWSISLSKDGLKGVMSSNRSGNSELYLASRSGPSEAFNGLTLLTGASSPGAEEGPRLSADGKTLYFDSTKNGSRDLFVSKFGDDGGVRNVAALTSLNTAALEGAPVLSPDELTIYFFSDRAPTTDGDIYVATRKSKSEAFGNVTVVPNVNSPGLDAPSQISGDGCSLYIASTRLGKFDIFVSRRIR